MRIVYKDGGVLTCSSFVIEGDTIYADDYLLVPINDIEYVEDGE